MRLVFLYFWGMVDPLVEARIQCYGPDQDEVGGIGCAVSLR